MDDFKNKIEAILKTHFTGAETEVDALPDGERVDGFLIWDGFLGKRQTERQSALWDVLERLMPVEEQRKITALFTLTSWEFSGYREGLQ